MSDTNMPQPDDTPEWVKRIFEGMNTRLSYIEERLKENVQSVQKDEGKSGSDGNSGSEPKPEPEPEPERKPKRRKSWVFRD